VFLRDKNNHSIYYDLYIASKKWLKVIRKLLEGVVVKLERSLYSYNNLAEQVDDSWKLDIPNEFTLKRMDLDLYNKYVKEIDPSYKYVWGSANEFLSKGFGFCLLINSEFVSVCNTFYVGGGYAELDIMTKSEYRRQGLAVITCKAFIEHSIHNQLIPFWDADAGNEPSNKLAVKLGFNKIKNVNILWWHEDKKVIESYLNKYNYI